MTDTRSKPGNIISYFMILVFLQRRFFIIKTDINTMF